MQWIATTAYGLEGVTARELEQLGYDVLQTQTSRVTFEGDMQAAADANVWLRTAGRVRMQCAQFPARSFDELFEGVRAIPWAQYLRREDAFPVTARSVNSALASVPDCQSIAKKAIVESLKTRYRADWFAESGVQVPVEVHLHKDIATVSLDTSGQPLHVRGYRKLNGPAALRETLAAALVLLTKWQGDRAFADPMCGTGTIAIEAAMYALQIAPGARRTFLAERWPWLEADAFDQARRHALALRKQNLQPQIFATDIDEQALSMARYHAKMAGVEAHIQITHADACAFAPQAEQGHLITNPPYGQRMGDMKQARALYAALGSAYARLPGWAFHIISDDMQFESAFGMRADKARELKNGPIRCRYYEFFRHRGVRA